MFHTRLWVVLGWPKNNHIVFTNWWHHLVVAANKSRL